MKETKNAFNIVELMVIVALISALSFVAVPNFRAYIIRSQVSNSISVLQQMIDIWAEQYQFSRNISSLNAFGSTIDSSGQDVVIDDIRRVLYSQLSGASSGKYQFCVFLAELDNMIINDGLGSYESPSTGTGGQRSMICMEVMAINGNLTTYCGVNSNTNGNRGVPEAYLPSSCKCDLTLTPPICP